MTAEPRTGEPRTDEPRSDELTEPYEERIAEIWSAALGVPVTTAGHDFFAGGGDSFQAAVATAHVRREWDLEITVQLLIDHPVLGDFAHRVARCVNER
ncbi:phosphopantetheine-binding protein [Streptomyces sp. NPDC008137]|uniref:phosphopantetheine-binding protein n=1 Tax=Streptomyces sp. NPDC008137 TaxID=3364813 RepID=UPI0036E10917